MKKNLASVTSDVTNTSAKVFKKRYADSFIGPRVSTAIGRNVYAVESSAYFSHFLAAVVQRAKNIGRKVFFSPKISA